MSWALTPGMMQEATPLSGGDRPLTTARARFHVFPKLDEPAPARRQECDQCGYYVAPTIFDDVDNASRLGQEEIFGPVVTVTTFRDETEAVELANAVDFGLVAEIWSGDYPRAMRVARRIRAGTVWIWDNYAQPVEGIWGGYKQSGMGRELGYHGLNDFIEIKQIFTDGTGLAMKPPYGQVIKE
jgi:betaine-aldehyde dehydrogenase